MLTGLRYLTVVVADYDAAIAWYTGVLGFTVVEDSIVNPEKRWVVLAPGPHGSHVLLAKASNPSQQAAIGHQSGGRVFLFLESDDFSADYHCLKDRGVHFVEEPRHEAYGKVVVFEDLYGNRWDLLESLPLKPSETQVPQKDVP